MKLSNKLAALASLMVLVAQPFSALDATAAAALNKAVDTSSAEYKAVEVPKDVKPRARDIMRLQPELRKISDNIYMGSGIGNAFLIRTPEGNVIFDTGVPWQAKQLRELLLSVGHEKTTHIIVSHAHGDHMGGLSIWKDVIDQGAELVAHSRYPYMNRIYNDTEAYLWVKRTASIYPSPPASGAAMGVRMSRKVQPTKLVTPQEDYLFEVGGVKFEVISMQNGAEGEDNLILWLPEQQVAFTGDLFGPLFPMVPNLYTVRGEKVRDPLGYIDALDRMISLEPSMLVPGHFEPVVGKNYIHKSLVVTRDGVKYVYNETVKGMDEGKSVYDLMESIKLPESLELSQGHGKTSWNVRAIWELLSGWFYFEDIADLYHVPEKAVYADVVKLLGGSDKLVTLARKYHAQGKDLKALRLLDIAKNGDPESIPELSLRIEVYKKLLEESEQGHDNVSLTDILRAALKASQKELSKRTGS